MKHKDDRKQHESINFNGKGKYINKIEYYKLVVQFRNAVFDSAFEKGVLSAFNRILDHIDVMTYNGED